jgi:hypothetical protein
MKAKILLLSVLIITTVGCAKKEDLDAANAKVVELQAQIVALTHENAALKAALAKKPKLPVTLALRKAMMGPGFVAVFSTTVKSSVPVLATIRSSALGTTKQFELHLNPSVATELGHLEGATIETGDVITLENQNYSPVSFTVNP